MVPVYIHYMGSEAYGLVGFYAVLQALFQLLDLGLSPTMSREAARFDGGGTNAAALRGLLRLLTWIFVIVGAAGGAALFVGADVIATRWLHVQQLPLDAVRRSVMLMSGVVFAQWMCSLYRGAITGFEKLVWLGGYNIAISTLRYIGVVPVFILMGVAPEVFFGYQLCVAVFGLAVLVVFTYRSLPKAGTGQTLVTEWRELKSMLHFSLMIAFTGGVWVIMTQTDKLVLSKLLPLAEYGYYTVAVQAASGVMLASGPVSVALLPRLTNLEAKHDVAAFEQAYRGATQLICAVSVSVSVVMALFAKQVLWVWTGNEALAQAVAPVLTLYALGNGVLSVSAFPYYLQYAKGDLKLHVIGNLLFLIFEIPAVVILTRAYGMIGAAAVWAGANFLYFLFWVPLVHRRFMPRLHRRWLMWDVAAITVPPIVFSLVLNEFAPWTRGRVTVAAELAIIGAVTLALAVATSPVLRNVAMESYREYRKRLTAQ